MNWNRIELTVSEVVEGKISEIQNKYEVIYFSNRAPKEAAIFCSKADYKEKCSIYFSPIASRIGKHLLKEYAAVLSERPNKNEVGLLVGYDSDWKLLENN